MTKTILRETKLLCKFMNFKAKLQLTSSFAIHKGWDHILKQYFSVLRILFCLYSFAYLQGHAEKKGFKIINYPSNKSSAPFCIASQP